MIGLAENVYAFSYLLGVGLFVAIALGVIGFFAGRAICRRVRTARWTPEVGDKVIFRRDGDRATVEEINGSQLLVSYWRPNSMSMSKQWLDRSRVFFHRRPAQKQPAA